MKRAFLSIIVLAVFGTTFFVINNQNQNDITGTLTITVVDQIGDTVSSKSIDFTKTDTLYDLLQDNYTTIGCADTTYDLTTHCDSTFPGTHVILQIDDVVTDWDNSYLAIYVNDEYATKGVDSLELKNGMVIRFEYTSLGGE